MIKKNKNVIIKILKKPIKKKLTSSLKKSNDVLDIGKRIEKLETEIKELKTMLAM
ncbi:MAG: hypothetical protein Q8Q90_01895 [bacterium]|nr:hypothetical protein [bacterium]